MKRALQVEDDDQNEHNAKRLKLEEEEVEQVRFMDLPIEMFVYIMSYLKLFDVMNCSHVCRTMRYDVIQNDLLWKVFQFDVLIGHERIEEMVIETNEQPMYQMLHEFIGRFSVYKSKYRKEICNKYIRRVQWNIHQNAVVLDAKELQRFNKLFPKLTHLKIKFPTSQNHKFLELLSSIGKLKELEDLNIEFISDGTPAKNRKSDDQDLAKILTEFKSKLRSFGIRNDSTEGSAGEELTQKIIESLNVNHPALDELELSNETWTVLKLLSHRSEEQKLQNLLRLTLNNLSDIIRESISTIVLPKLVYLDVSFHYCKEDTSAISELFSNSCPLLQFLNVSIIPPIPRQLEGLISIHNSSLRKLKIISPIPIDLYLGNIEVLQADRITSMTIPENNSLTRLILRNPKAVILDDVIQNCKYLRTLHLTSSQSIKSLRLNITDLVDVQLLEFKHLESIELESNSRSMLERLILSDCHRLATIDARNVASLPNFATLDISNCSECMINDPVFINTRHLTLRESKQHLWSYIVQNCKLIRDISISNVTPMQPLTYTRLEQLINKYNLKRLHIDSVLSPNIPQFNFESNTLEYLDIDLRNGKSPVYINCYNLKDLVLTNMQASTKLVLAQLDSLSCINCNFAMISILSHVSKRNTTEKPCSPVSIDIQSTGVQLTNWNKFFDYSRLKRLTIKTQKSDITFDETSFQNILSNAHSLEILHAQVPSGLKSLIIENLPELKALCFNNCNMLQTITLGHLPLLVKLDLTRCSSLSKLNIRGTGILFDSLVACNFRGTKVTDSFLAILLSHCDNRSLKWANARNIIGLSKQIRAIIQTLNRSGTLDKEKLKIIIADPPKHEPKTRKKKSKKPTSSTSATPNVVIEEL
jgi:hypothetical protein